VNREVAELHLPLGERRGEFVDLRLRGGDLRGGGRRADAIWLPAIVNRSRFSRRSIRDPRYWSSPTSPPA